jgi:hypothetical protein
MAIIPTDLNIGMAKGRYKFNEKEFLDIESIIGYSIGNQMWWTESRPLRRF